MDSAAFKKFVKENGIVTLKADKSSSAGEQIRTLLIALGNDAGAIPFYAIFPADNPNKPITFDGLLSSDGVIEKLKEAGPSIGRAESTASDTEGDQRTSKTNDRNNPIPRLSETKDRKQIKAA